MDYLERRRRLVFNICKILECLDRLFYYKVKKFIWLKFEDNNPEWVGGNGIELIGKKVVSQTNKMRFEEARFLFQENSKLQNLIFDRIISDLYTIFDANKQTFSINEDWINSAAECEKNRPHRNDLMKNKIDAATKRVKKERKELFGKISIIRSNFVSHHNNNIFKHHFLHNQMKYSLVNKEAMEKPRQYQNTGCGNGLDVSDIEEYLRKIVNIFIIIINEIKRDTPDTISSTTNYDFLNINRVKCYIYKELKFRKVRIDFKTDKNFLLLQQSLSDFNKLIQNLTIIEERQAYDIKPDSQMIDVPRVGGQ